MISMKAAGEYGHVVQPAQPSTVSCVPWWGGIGSHFIQTASLYNPLKSLPLDHSSGVPCAVQRVGLQSLQSSLKQGTCQAQSDSQGCDRSNGNEQQNQQSVATVIPSAPSQYLVPHTQLELGHSIARVAYPYADPYIGGIVAAYGAQPMIHPHMLGVQQARIPLPLETEEEPVYVNAKQYRGILRRRQLRAKAELENKVVKVRKPYLHESRHLHAMRRARGCGGRFLNTKKLEESKVSTDIGNGSEGLPIQAGSSSGSEALQSENGNIMFLQDIQGTLGLSGSEVTSMAQSYCHGKSCMYSINNGIYLNNHQHQHFPLSAFHPLSSGSDEGDSGQGGCILLSNGSQQRAVAIQ